MIADATLPIVVKAAMTMFLLLSRSRPLRAPNNSPSKRLSPHNWKKKIMKSPRKVKITLTSLPSNQKCSVFH